MRRKLRFGILADPRGMRAWEARALELLRASGHAEIVLAAPLRVSAIGGDAMGPEWINGPENAFLHRLWDRLESKFAIRHDAGARIDPCWAAGAAKWVEYESMSTAWETSIRAADLDVLLCFGEEEDPGGTEGLARLGVWRIAHRDPQRPSGSPPGFREILSRSPVMGSALLTRLGPGEERVLFRSQGATMDISLRLNHQRNCWKSAAFPARAAGRILSAGICDADGIRRLFPAAHSGTDTRPGTGAWIAFLAANVRRRTANMMSRVRYRQEWSLMISAEADWKGLPAGLRPIHSGTDRFWADPRLISESGKHWLFFEELVYARKRGHLSVMEVFPDGTHGEPVRILEKEYHLSYPFVFRDGSSWFLVPESAGNRTIDLYRARRFPFEWEHVSCLMRDVHAVDSTLLKWDGRWWLFSNLSHTPGASSYDELFLFHSEWLESETWTPHPLNPIVSDVRRARPAGALFETPEGLIRPAQDCSRSYGNGIVWNKVVKLSTKEYEEIPLGRLDPGWAPGIVGTHTYSAVPGLTFIDAYVRRPRR